MRLFHSLSNMGLVLAAMVLIAMPMVSAYEFEEDSVLIDDSLIYIRVTPAVAASSGWITLDFRSKDYTGDVDFTFGFDTDVSKPKKAELYNPRFVNVTKSLSCPDPFWYNYTASHVWCWETINPTNGSEDILIWEHDFDYADLPSDTIYYYEDQFKEWDDISGIFTAISYDFDGKDIWFVKTGVPIVQDQDYKIRVWVDVPVCFVDDSSCSGNGKYDFAIKPSSETIPQAIAAGHFYLIDPWWDSIWLKRQAFSIQNTNTTTAMPAGQVVELIIDSTGPDYRDDGDDVRIMFTDDSEATWTEVPIINMTVYNSISTRIYFKLLASIPQSASSDNQYYIYYGNDAATAPGYTGQQVFNLWDDFDNDINASVWGTISGCSWVSSGYAHCDYDQGGTHTLRTSATVGNFSVMLTKWEMEDVSGTAVGPRWHIFGTSGDCSEARYSVENDYLAISTWPTNAAPFDFSEDVWYNAKVVRGGGSVNNEMWVDWVKYVDNSTAICKQDTGTVGWVTGEDADHNINIDTFAVYDYFYPVPTLNLTGEETAPIIIPEVDCPAELVALCDPAWTSASCSGDILYLENNCSIQITEGNITGVCSFVTSKSIDCQYGCSEVDGICKIPPYYEAGIGLAIIALVFLSARWAWVIKRRRFK